MTVPRQTPIRIEPYQYRRKIAGKYPFSQGAPDVVLGSKLRNDHQRRRPATSRQFGNREEHLTRYTNAAFDRRVATIRNQQTGERHQPRFVLRTLPDESRPEMWSIVIEVPPEQLGHEDRDDRDGLTEARQLACEPQIHLICAVPMNSEVGALDSENGTHLRWDRFLPGQSLAKHHGFAAEHNRGTFRIDR